MSRGLAEAIRRLLHDRKVETRKRRWPELPPWMFCTTEGEPLPKKVVARVFASALKAAGLPAHFRWLPMSNTAAVDRLDNATGSKVVANVAGAGRTMGEHEGQRLKMWSRKRAAGETAPSCSMRGGMRQSVALD